MSVDILDLGDEHADYLRDESRRVGRAEKIAFPQSTVEVREALARASANHWPVTVQGGRTGISGGCVPEGGLILNLSRMNAIGCIDGEHMTVQPGALLADIRAALADSGLFFPSDLTETTASIGGMVANNASGARSFKYGAVRRWIHALEVVLPSGETVRLERGVHQANGLDFQIGSIGGVLPDRRQPAGVKSAAGYYIEPDMDLVDLFVGAEGTLGVVTEITLKLLPKPAQMTGLTAFFEDEAGALEFVRFLRAARWGTGPTTPDTVGRVPDPAAIELFDCNALELLRRMRRERPAFAGLPELKPEFHTALYFEFDDEVPDAVVEMADEAMDCWLSEGEREMAALKTFRHAVPEAVNLLIGERGLTKLGTDMSVPDERLEEVMRMYHSGLADAGLEYVIFGHIGNNHVHVNILPRNAAEYAQGRALYLDWAKQVVAWGGSVSAEHGIGKLKPRFLALMLGEQGVQELRKLKRLFDPDAMLNSGNMFANN